MSAIEKLVLPEYAFNVGPAHSGTGPHRVIEYVAYKEVCHRGGDSRLIGLAHILEQGSDMIRFWR